MQLESLGGVAGFGREQNARRMMGRAWIGWLRVQRPQEQ
jgi:hypothetical protein